MVPPIDLPIPLLKSDLVDVRELANVLLALNAAVLVFSLTFADRLAGPGPGWRSAKLALIGAWSSFLVAIAMVGVSVCDLVMAVGRAGRGGGAVEAALARSYGLLLGAGLLSGLGLSGLFVAAVLSLRLREAP